MYKSLLSLQEAANRLTSLANKDDEVRKQANANVLALAKLNGDLLYLESLKATLHAQNGHLCIV